MTKKYIASMIVIAIIAISNVGTANAFYIGQRGQEVVDLQITLIEAGFDIPAITSGVATPGYFGPQTQAALAAREASGVKLGAVAGPDLYFPYFGVNDVREYSFSSNLKLATSTVCSFRTPGATTTLTHAAIRFVIASTSATVLDIAKDTSPSASTTKIGSTYVIAASAAATVVASTTGSVGGDATIFAPNTFLNFKIGPSSGDGIGNAARGVCNAQFIEI